VVFPDPELPTIKRFLIWFVENVFISRFINYLYLIVSPVASELQK
jgi:hypothetical protein